MPGITNTMLDMCAKVRLGYVPSHALATRSRFGMLTKEEIYESLLYFVLIDGCYEYFRIITDCLCLDETYFETNNLLVATMFKFNRLEHVKYLVEDLQVSETVVCNNRTPNPLTEAVSRRHIGLVDYVVSKYKFLSVSAAVGLNSAVMASRAT